MAETNEESIREIKRSIASLRKTQMKLTNTVLGHETMSHEVRIEKAEAAITKIKSGYVENSDCMRMTHTLEQQFKEHKNEMNARIDKMELDLGRRMDSIKKEMLELFKKLKTDKIRLIGWLLSASGWAGIFIALFTLIKRIPTP